MRGDLLKMSDKEVSRLEVIQRVEAGVLKQKAAAKQLGLSARQIIRLLKSYRREGAAGLVSKHRGRCGNRGHSQAFKAKVLEQVKQHYYDFGPTLAAEKLEERDKLSVNRETLRQWMMAEGLWKGKAQKKIVVHQQRVRRPCLGELVQIDGSPHDWFEGRRDKCCLLVFIDDATSRLMELLFVEQETTEGYFTATRQYLGHHGRPMAFYSDKHGIFRVNIPEAKSGTGETQFGRAMRELGIEAICANSPQAKGRVERANGTLQDRLVKELRLRGINTMEAANAYLPEFIKNHNEQFAVEPARAENSHRLSVPDETILDLIFSHQQERRLSKNLELSYKNVTYQIQSTGKGYTMRHSTVKVCENAKGDIELFYKGKLLPYKTFDKKNQRQEAVNGKELNPEWEQRLKTSRDIQGHKPSANHPWRQYDKVLAKKRRKAA